MDGIGDIGSFKFSYLVKGRLTGRKPGQVTEAGLVLDGELVPFDAISATYARGGRLAVSLRPGFEVPPGVGAATSSEAAFVIAPARVGARPLEMAIDRHTSVFDTHRNQQRLREEGREDLIRSTPCSVCGSEIDLSGLPEARYVYCPYCRSLFSSDPAAVIDGAHYDCCDECGMFDRVQRYNEFYFYFLVIAWGFSSTPRYLCDACARQLFLKTLFANLLFVVGVPNALSIGLRARLGRDPRLANLPRANRAARKGRYDEADVWYGDMLAAWPDHPGILTNRAHAHINGGDIDGATACVAKALDACANYPPALRLVL